MKLMHKYKIMFLLSILCMIFIVVGCSKNDTMIIDNKEVNVAKEIPVLMYHHFDDTSDAGAVVIKDEFKKQIKDDAKKVVDEYFSQWKRKWIQYDNFARTNRF